MSFIVTRPLTIHVNEFVDRSNRVNNPYYNTLTVKLAQKIKLVDCEVKLNHLFVYYSWFNISAGLNNNFFQLIFDYQILGVNPMICDFTIPDGNWEFGALRTWFRQEQIRRGYCFYIPNQYQTFQFDGSVSGSQITTSTGGILNIKTFADIVSNENSYTVSLIVYPVAHAPYTRYTAVGLVPASKNSSVADDVIVPNPTASIFGGIAADLCGTLLVEQSNVSNPSTSFVSSEGCVNTMKYYDQYGTDTFYCDKDYPNKDGTGKVNPFTFTDKEPYTSDNGQPYPAATFRTQYFYPSSQHYTLFPSPDITLGINYRQLARNTTSVGYTGPLPPVLGLDVRTTYPRFRIPAGFGAVIGQASADYPPTPTIFIGTDPTLATSANDYAITYTNTVPPQITQYNSIIVGCDLCENSVTRDYSDVVYAFAPDTASGSQISINNIENWVSCVDKETDLISIRLYAENNTPVQVRDPQRSASITIRPRAPSSLKLLDGPLVEAPGQLNTQGGQSQRPYQANDPRPPGGGGKRQRWEDNDVQTGYNPAMFAQF